MKDLDAHDDLVLLTAAQAGDRAAFGAFYRRHERKVLGSFRRQGAAADVAADLTAETFAAALVSLPTFRAEQGAPLAWVFGIARHTLWRSWERGQVEARARQRLGMPVLPLDDDDLARIERLDDEPALAALAELPEEQRIAVEARVLEEQEYAEIAAALRCSEQVVRKRVSRGLAALRARMQETT